MKECYTPYRNITSFPTTDVHMDMLHCMIYHRKISKSLHVTKTCWTAKEFAIHVHNFRHNLCLQHQCFMWSHSHTLYLNLQCSLRAQCSAGGVYHLLYIWPSHLVSHDSPCCLIWALLDVSCRLSFFQIPF
jgi:hypothetical protein